MADTLERNIKYLMDKAGISSVTGLARQLKMQQSTLHRMLTGEVRDPKYTTLSHIASFLACHRSI
ncbi:helix-turn-helix transcriptional regulator [Apirhabdus apintestini]|nr:helix-turn-helix transcriptional regulator [Enterobacteriaceae bacterium CA-0114]